MKYFNLEYKQDIMPYNIFYEKLCTHDFVHLVGNNYNNNNNNNNHNNNEFDINKFENDINTIFSDKSHNFDQIMFHIPKIIDNEKEYICINDVNIIKKCKYNVDLKNFDRTLDKIKQIIIDKPPKTVYTDINYYLYASSNIEITYPNFQMVPSIIKTASLLDYAELFYSTFIGLSQYDARILSKKIEKSGFMSCYLCKTNIDYYKLWNPYSIYYGKSLRKNKDNMTIVTGFNKLNKTRSPKYHVYDYIEKSKQTLSIRQKMVIFLSKEFIKQVVDFRKSIGMELLTKIVEIDESDLYMIDQIDSIKNNTSKNVSPYNDPKYIMAVNSRYKYMENAIDKNYFNTDYFSWIDFSAGHIVEFPPNVYFSYNRIDKIRIAWIARYKNMHFTYNHQALGGGIFIGHKTTMKKYCKLHDKEFRKLMEKGYNINDDKLCFLIFEKYPELFDIYFASYGKLLVNIYSPIK